MSHYVSRALSLLADAVELVMATVPYEQRAERDLHTLPKVPVLRDAAERSLRDAEKKLRAEGVDVHTHQSVWTDVVAELNVRRTQRLRAVAYRKARDEQRAAERATYAI